MTPCMMRTLGGSNIPDKAGSERMCPHSRHVEVGNYFDSEWLKVFEVVHYKILPAPFMKRTSSYRRSFAIPKSPAT